MWSQTSFSVTLKISTTQVSCSSPFVLVRHDAVEVHLVGADVDDHGGESWRSVRVPSLRFNDYCVHPALTGVKRVGTELRVVLRRCVQIKGTEFLSYPFCTVEGKEARFPWLKPDFDQVDSTDCDVASEGSARERKPTFRKVLLEKLLKRKRSPIMSRPEEWLDETEERDSKEEEDRSEDNSFDRQRSPFQPFLG